MRYNIKVATDIKVATTRYNIKVATYNIKVATDINK